MLNKFQIKNLKILVLFLFDLFIFILPIQVQSADLPDIPKIISRTEWGADEKLTTWEPSYAKNSNGEIIQKAEKIILHHTASRELTPDSDNSGFYKSMVQNIFRFHTFNAAWHDSLGKTHYGFGDIGYHYLIDPNGNIYQGRAGKNGVIGAHAYGFNKQTIGIALIGTYGAVINNQLIDHKISAKMQKSLEQLIGWLASANSIDLEKTTQICGKNKKGEYNCYNYKGLIGHKHVSATACPGATLENILNIIRFNASFYANQYKTYAYKSANKIYKIENGQSYEYAGNYNKLVQIPVWQLELFSKAKQSGQSSLKELLETKIKIGIMALERGQILQISANAGYQVCNAGDSDVCLPKSAGEITNLTYSSASYVPTGSFLNRIVPNTDQTILEIISYEDRPGWKPELNDNKFRGSILVEYSQADGKLWVINQLSLEDYVKGIAEILDTDPMEHLKTMSVASRSYAYYYILRGGKHKNTPYHLVKGPTDQTYKGYGFEQRALNWLQAVEATKDQVIEFNGKPALPVYSSSTGGVSLDACKVWGTMEKKDFCSNDFEYLRGGVRDPEGTDQRYGTEDCGKNGLHCVGLSADGSRQMARLGKTYKEILAHYYPGISIHIIDIDIFEAPEQGSGILEKQPISLTGRVKATPELGGVATKIEKDSSFAKISIPPDALQAEAEIGLAVLENLSDELESLGQRIYQLSAVSGQKIINKFEKSVQITFYYLDKYLKDIDEQSLKILYKNSSDKSWNALDSSLVDPGSNTISASLLSPGQILLAGDSKSINNILEHHPNGSLINYNGAVWLIQDNKRRGFPSPQVVNSYRFDWTMIVPANNADKALPEGEIMPYKTGSLIADSGAVWMIGDNLAKRGFGSSEAFEKNGYSWNKVIQADLLLSVFGYREFGAISNNTQAHPAGTLIEYNHAVWKITNDGKREGAPTPEVLNSWGIDWEMIVPANQEDAKLPETEKVMQFRDGTLLRQNSELYIMSDSRMKKFESLDVFKGMGYDLDKVVDVD